MLQSAVRLGKVARAMATPSVRRAYRSGQSAFAVGAWSSAIDEYETVLQAEPGWATVWFRLGLAQSRQQRFAAAEASYRRAIEYGMETAELQLQLGNALKMQRRIAAAAACYLKAAQIDSTCQARNELQWLGYDAAALDTALATGAALSAPPLQHLEAADKAWNSGDWAQAEEHFAEVLRADPSRAAVWTMLGHVQREQRDFAAAEESYRRLVALEPDRADAHRLLGDALKLQRRFADAADCYLRAVQLDAQSIAREELLSFGYRKSVLDAALEAGALPAAPPWERVEAANRARAGGDWPRAASLFSEALRADPEWAAIWVQFGHAQKEQGELASAEASYRRAIALEPQVADTRLQLGHVLKMQQRFAEAAASYFEAVRLAPGAREGLYARAELVSFGYRSAAVDKALLDDALAWPPAQKSAAAGPPPALSIIGRHFAAIDDGDGRPPMLFRHPVLLPDREQAILVDLQTMGSSAAFDFDVSLTTAAGGDIPVEAMPNSHGTHVLTYRCRPPHESDAEIVVRGVLPPGFGIRRIEIGEPDLARVWPVPHRGPGPGELPLDQVRNFIIGTTGVCNANCPHCPTNKLVPSAQFASEMPLGLFHSLVDQLLENRVFITGHISLGLFGDGLLDRHVVERARRLRTAFPHAPLHCNTNAAAYNRGRHAALGSIVDIMAVHVETLDEQKYSKLMAPLRLPNVLPKVNQIIEDMAPIVSIAAPMHRANIDDLDAIRAYFAERGVCNTIFTPISNRCSRDEVFRELAFGAKAGSCPEEIIFDLIVDWDGTVLVCCNDFLRQEPIGKLGENSLLDILRGARRQRFFDALRTGAWEELETCKNCKFDCGPHAVGAA